MGGLRVAAHAGGDTIVGDSSLEHFGPGCAVRCCAPVTRVMTRLAPSSTR
jgi:hypothetical protein